MGKAKRKCPGLGMARDIVNWRARLEEQEAYKQLHIRPRFFQMGALQCTFQQKMECSGCDPPGWPDNQGWEQPCIMLGHYHSPSTDLQNKYPLDRLVLYL